MFSIHPSLQYDIQIARHRCRSHPARDARDVTRVRRAFLAPYRARSR